MTGARSLHRDLCPELLDGTAAAQQVAQQVARQAAPQGMADELPTADDVAFCFYGRLFRGEEEVLATTPYLDAGDICEGLDSELLAAWWHRAAVVDDRVVPPDEEVLGRAPRWAQRAVLALSRSRFFAPVGERVLIGDLKQVSAYLTDPSLRRSVQHAVSDAITADTRVVVGHSLGSVVVYEALCAHPEWPVHSLVTLGSPLGLRHLVFPRLAADPPGVWPGGVSAWTNITDRGDVVAVEEDLRPLFGPRLRQVRIDNGVRAHDLGRYLSAAATGAAILAGFGG
ncbi:hypothetical protein ACIQXA_35990 [Streptomyces massasporeus]|uniref:hypothetical protein n=1 Tax=Streptomyces massasporeus TaxID=67324 RepID=UPI0037FE0AA2